MHHFILYLFFKQVNWDTVLIVLFCNSFSQGRSYCMFPGSFLRLQRPISANQIANRRSETSQMIFERARVSTSEVNNTRGPWAHRLAPLVPEDCIRQLCASRRFCSAHYRLPSPTRRQRLRGTTEARRASMTRMPAFHYSPRSLMSWFPPARGGSFHLFASAALFQHRWALSNAQ